MLFGGSQLSSAPLYSCSCRREVPCKRKHTHTLLSQNNRATHKTMKFAIVQTGQEEHQSKKTNDSTVERRARQLRPPCRPQNKNKKFLPCTLSSSFGKNTRVSHFMFISHSLCSHTSWISSLSQFSSLQKKGVHLSLPKITVMFLLVSTQRGFLIISGSSETAVSLKTKKVLFFSFGFCYTQGFSISTTIGSHEKLMV